jgi:hypothetical protein
MTRTRAPSPAASPPAADERPAPDRLPTYQALLDEAVQETFPASDPIAPGGAMHADKPVRTRAGGRDWRLDPQADAPAAERCVIAEFADEPRGRRALDEALAANLPGARLDMPAPGHPGLAAATLLITVRDDDQCRRAESIARRAGAYQVDVARPPAPGR